jgi:hypothetical protein
MRVSGVNAVGIKNALNLICCNLATLILIDCSECFTNAESFVAEQGLTESFYLTLLVKYIFD